MNPRSLLLGLLCGLGITLFTLLIPYTYCQNGDGRGLPFAAICPSCGGTFASLGARQDRCTQVFDPLKLVGNIALWGGTAAGGLSWFQRRRRFA